MHDLCLFHLKRFTNLELTQCILKKNWCSACCFKGWEWLFYFCFYWRADNHFKLDRDIKSNVIKWTEINATCILTLVTILWFPLRINLKFAPFGQIFELWKIFRIFDSSFKTAKFAKKNSCASVNGLVQVRQDILQSENKRGTKDAPFFTA